jgi:hypothetical protein
LVTVAFEDLVVGAAGEEMDAEHRAGIVAAVGVGVRAVERGLPRRRALC